jgi:hypothetical protein
MTKYGFNLRTRSGQRVDNISILAQSLEDAEKRLRQMYHHCEIIECRQRAVPARLDGLDLESVLGLISRQPVGPNGKPVAVLGRKAGVH